MLWLVLIVVAIIAIWYMNKESFSSKREKAESIVSWFGQNEPTYNSFKRDMAGQSDILDYTAAKQLFDKKILDVKRMEPLL